MLLDFTTLMYKYKLKVRGVIQVGAHFCEEYDDFKKNGIERMILIEPCRKAFSILRSKFGGLPNITIWNHACGDVQGEATMYTGDETVNKGMSNSLLKPALHLQLHQDVKFTDTEQVSVELLDNLVTPNERPFYNLLVMDCQGFEGNVLRGATEVLPYIDYVYTEINFGNVYENCTQADELDALLHEYKRVETGAKVGGLWSDSLYIHKRLLQ